MNTHNGEQLKAAAQAGNIDLLYAVNNLRPFKYLLAGSKHI